MKLADHAKMHLIFVVIALLTLSCNTNRQINANQKFIDSTIYSPRPRDLVSTKIKLPKSSIQYVFFRITDIVYAVQIIRHDPDSSNAFTYFYLNDELVKATLSTSRYKKNRPKHSLGKYYFNDGHLIGKSEKRIQTPNVDSLFNEANFFLKKAKTKDF